MLGGTSNPPHYFRDSIKAHAMNVHSSNFRDLAAAEFDTTTLLAHAAEQAAARRYEDFCIVDVDCHQS